MSSTTCQLYREICQSQLRREELEGRQGSAVAPGPGRPDRPRIRLRKGGC